MWDSPSVPSLNVCPGYQKCVDFMFRLQLYAVETIHMPPQTILNTHIALVQNTQHYWKGFTASEKSRYANISNEIRILISFLADSGAISRNCDLRKVYIAPRAPDRAP